MKTFAVSLLLVATFGVAACSSSGGKTVPVSEACDRAMQKIADEGPDAANAVMVADDDRALNACKTPGEWMAAAKNHRSSGIDHCVVCSNATVFSVWNAECVGNTTAPACLLPDGSPAAVAPPT